MSDVAQCYKNTLNIETFDQWMKDTPAGIGYMFVTVRNCIFEKVFDTLQFKNKLSAVELTDAFAHGYY